MEISRKKEENSREWMLLEAAREILPRVSRVCYLQPHYFCKERVERRRKVERDFVLCD